MQDTTKISVVNQPAVASLIDQANVEHDACCLAAGSALNHAIRAGELLRQAKDCCEHGDWQDWLRNNFNGSRRTAQAYLRLAAHRDVIEKRSGDALLSVGQALRLLAKPKPAAASQDEPADDDEEAARIEAVIARGDHPTGWLTRGNDPDHYQFAGAYQICPSAAHPGYCHLGMIDFLDDGTAVATETRRPMKLWDVLRAIRQQFNAVPTQLESRATTGLIVAWSFAADVARRVPGGPAQ